MLRLSNLKKKFIHLFYIFNFFYYNIFLIFKIVNYDKTSLFKCDMNFMEWLYKKVGK